MKNKVIFFAVVFTLLALNYTGLGFVHYLPGMALILGLVLTTLQNSDEVKKISKKWASNMLSYGIIFLGFGFNIVAILQAGASGIGYTVVSIFGTLVLGLLLGKILRNQGKISTLISSGTAICGGSAIAAIAPVIRASSEETAVAMGAVFLLNAVGLLLFPIIGHWLDLTQTQFGLLSALAIHDTSSVVGSTLAYGQQSLEVGTTIKLVRALWIVPVALIIAAIYSRMNHAEVGHGKAKKPWFILWFIVASLTVTIFPSFADIGKHLKHFGESLFTVALFMVGYNVSFSAIKAVGVRVISQAVILWIIVSVLVIVALKSGILSL